MKLLRVVCVPAVALLSQLALAADQPGQIGAMQAIFDFCGRVDSSQRAHFDQEAKAEYRGLTAGQIAALHKSAEYRRGYNLLSSVLPNLTSDDAMSGCVALVPTKPEMKAVKLGLEKRP
jgi:hypothetical protein